MSHTNRELLAALRTAFPQLFTSIEEDGQTVERLDLERVRQLAGEGNYTDKFGLRWENKPEKFEADSVGKLPTLKHVADRAITASPGKPTHVLIEGDNYHALQVLAYTHERSVDVIYIDPPYNTGNKDFKYNDRFVDREDGYRHSKWLSFMAKRLRLARSLLKDSGAVFISIDDNEFAQLKLLCDEIFGPTCFVESFVWNKKSAPSGVPPRSMVVNIHESILCYSRTPGGFRFVGKPRSDETFSNPDNDRRGPWRSANVRSSISTKSFSVKNPETGEVFTDTWAYSPEEFSAAIDQKRILWPKKSGGQLRIKEYFREFKNSNTPIVSQLGTFTGQSSIEFLREILGKDIKAMYPKPLELMKALLGSATRSTDIVLDFFAGSGTTGHAVMQLNAEDGGTRHCILVTNDEGEFKDDSDAVLPGGICTHVTYPRLKKVIEGYTTPKGKAVAGLGENLAFFRTAFHPIPETRNQTQAFAAACVPMLNLKSDCFSVAEQTREWVLFEGTGKHLFVLLDDLAAEAACERLQSVSGPVEAYVFAYELDDDSAELLGELPNVTVQEVPRPILDLFHRLRSAQQQ